jgi:hypothetical protein
VQGPVLEPFVYDEAHPYAAGQHRGVDLGADTAGETVVAPAAGTVSFAGTVPTNGKSVTIETADGYSVTLTHLGSIAVAKGAAVAEQDAIGTVGPSGTPEVDGPYVHLGIRVTTDPNGYVDPLSLLPPAPDSGADQSGSTATQPGTTGAASAPPAQKQAERPAASPRPHAAYRPEATTQQASTRERGRAQASDTDAQPSHSSHRPRARDTRTSLEIARPRAHPTLRTGSIRRPFAEVSAAGSRTVQSSAQPRADEAESLLGLACNGAAALIAFGAAFAASRRRRPGSALRAASAQVVCLAPPAVERRHVSRAA